MNTRPAYTGLQHSLLWLACGVCAGASAQGSTEGTAPAPSAQVAAAFPATTGAVTHQTTSTVALVHVTIETDVSFDLFTKHLEALLGRFDPSLLRKAAGDARAIDAGFKALEGEEGLMLFFAQDHGALLSVAGAARKAKRYQIGNPLVAAQMTRLDIRAGLYAPLSVLVYQRAGEGVRIEFDLPSALFGQFGNAAVADIGRGLDDKLQRLIGKAVRMASVQ
jgi:uncharacterized protein (DUF302 family)